MLWEVDIYPAAGLQDRAAARLATEAAELELSDQLDATVAHGYLIEGNLDRPAIERIARELLSDAIVERTIIARVGDKALVETAPDGVGGQVVHVLPKPGVMDPVAQSTKAAIADLGVDVAAVRMLRKFWLRGLPTDRLQRLCSKLLANDAIEQVIVGPLNFEKLEFGRRTSSSCARPGFSISTIRPCGNCRAKGSCI